MSLILPEKIYFDEINFPELTEFLYGIFEKDFILSKTTFLGKKVVFDNRIIDGKYPEGFWHLITRTDHKENEQRLPDLKRAKRLPWIKPIIEQYKESEIKSWHNLEATNKGEAFNEVYYLWYEEGHYLVILKERKHGYFLATSFYVNDGFYREKYERKYKSGKPI